MIVDDLLRVGQYIFSLVAINCHVMLLVLSLSNLTKQIRQSLNLIRRAILYTSFARETVGGKYSGIRKKKRKLPLV
jgi:hypothetical protein